MKTVLLGEAWGRHEDQHKHALVGPSGRELTLELGATNFAPYMELQCPDCRTKTRFIGNYRCEHCEHYCFPSAFDLIAHWTRLRTECSIAVTNVFAERPPENQVGYFFGRERETDLPPYQTQGGKYLKAIHKHHIDRLTEEIADLKPNLIVALGNTACWITLDRFKISDLRGAVAHSERFDCKVIPTFHPAAIIRAQGLAMRPAALSDYKKARTECEFPEIRRRERRLMIPEPTSNRGISEINDWIDAIPLIALAVDIETHRGQITTIGFARSASEALVVPLRDIEVLKGKITDVGVVARRLGFKGGINFWPDAQTEALAWRAIIRLLDNPCYKIFQNGVYDLSYLLKLGIQPKNCLHDTMLWHHSLYPEMPKSLGFLVSIYGNEIAWKLMRRGKTLKRDE